jgi:tRNA threonylcarbamoyladenosine biosynthesis protein TsaE
MFDGAPGSAVPCLAVSRSEEDTRRLAAILAEKLPGGVTVLLTGDLGAGKTAFVRGFCEALGISRVRSPSFTLVNRYRAGEGEIVHSDLYRLSGGEGEDLDLHGEESDSLFLFIEWADRMNFSSDRPLLSVSITIPDIVNNPGLRIFSFRPANPPGEKILAPLRDFIEEKFPQ